MPWPRTLSDCLADSAANLGLADPDLESLVGARGWQRLSPAIRRRFRRGHGVTPVDYEGTLRIERSRLGAVFALAAKCLGEPLPLRRHAAAPALVRVYNDGHGGIVWERALSLYDGRPPLTVRSTKRRDGAGRLLECVDGGLGMVLAVFEDAGALVFESRRYFVEILGLGLRLPLPAPLTPGRCRVEHSDVDPGRFRFTMSMTHPLWGRTFFQDGIFHDPEEA